MKRFAAWCLVAQILLFTVEFFVNVCIAADQPIDERAAAEFFEKKIRPLLAKHCYECHAHDKAGDSGELAVDSRAALLKGGDRGPIMVAGKPDESLLLKALKYGDPKLQMPPEGKLPDAEIELLTKWIADGAFVPEYGVAAQKKGKEIDWTAARQFWSVRPLGRVAIPEFRISDIGFRNEGAGKAGDDAALLSIRNPQSAIRNPLDSFIVAKLHENGLAPSSAADKRTLIRRLAFDLIGLPPSPDEVAEFLADERPDAYERLVDRLLASPHFGERWARYWLDLARYVDDTPDWQKTTEQAWLYRDWVVRAFNEDRPYDEFVKLQLAADMMPETVPEDYAALGFVGLSPQYWKELKLAPSVIEVIVADEWDERLDAVSRTFLGLTVACARCHDHKFDAITTRDYYALAGVFASTDLSDRPLLPSPTAELVREARHKVDSLKESLKKTKGKESEEAQQLQQQIVDLREATPYFDTPMAPTIEEASVFVMPDGPDATKLDIRRRQPRDLPVFRRGNPSNPGDIVPRRFLELFSSATSQPFQQGSGRREFAEALFHDAQALTARVIVNRIWSHHFGKGLVRTPSDFGLQGERPSHPELLDWLSSEIAECGVRSAEGEDGRHRAAWALKRFHRLLVTSSTYR
ncbi:MAG: PSD1 domain-containing protein, partial [Candidatus Saccharimonas sp.]|nr:PSD1 domain-containing protein [Planctomycetaceae bacterium]